MPMPRMSSGIRARCRLVMMAARHRSHRCPGDATDMHVAATRLLEIGGVLWLLTFLQAMYDSQHTAIDRWASSPTYRSSAHYYREGAPRRSRFESC
jgi:hypothetical protein